MKVIYTFLLLLALSGFGVKSSFAESGHDHSKETKKHAHDKGHKHDHDDDESGHDGHDHKKKKRKHKSHKGHDAHEDHDHGKEDKKHKGHDHGKNGHDHSDHDENEEHGAHGSGESKSHAHSSEGGHEGHDEHGESSFGEGKAIVAIENEGQRFELSNESVSFLKITSRPIGDRAKSEKLQIDQKNLVEYQDKVGIFVRSGEWFELKEGKVLEESESGVLLLVHGLKSSDHLVTSRLGILRAAHLQAIGQGGKGHAH